MATGIFKRPVDGPVAVRALNLEGDQQADLQAHGGLHKAVYVYSWRNTEFWRQTLGRDDLLPGTFGENLTVTGLGDDAVGIGDRLEIGSAVFEVTQPRIPCYKLGIALGLPEFPKQFHGENRHGFYLRVLREGTVRAGDAVRWTRLPGSVTIAGLVEVYRRRIATADVLGRLAKLEALPKSWKSWLAAKIEVAR